MILLVSESGDILLFVLLLRHIIISSYLWYIRSWWQGEEGQDPGQDPGDPGVEKSELEEEPEPENERWTNPSTDHGQKARSLPIEKQCLPEPE